ncbi:MAG: restriction endonuclease, SacI family [Flavobacteriales bacterium]|nr:restriction endonuclease, SacI family [Flavobacteriales bacterium]
MEESFKSQLDSLLRKEWKKVLDAAEDVTFHHGLDETLGTLLRSNTVSYRYPVITQLLAKCANPSLDCTCIQATREPVTKGNFDARSVCHEVVVPWEFENECPLGGSKEPYINNPLRVSEFSTSFGSKQKNKAHWNLLIELFTHVEGHPKETLPALRQALMHVKAMQLEQRIDFPAPLRLSLLATLNAVREFLAQKSGGERLQLVCFALFSSMKERWGIFDEVHTAKINASDTAGRRPADVTCTKSNRTVLAIEVKDRDLSMELLESSIRNARLDNVSELMAFVKWKNAPAIAPFDKRIQEEFGKGMNVYVVDSEEFLTLMLTMLGEDGRKVFVQEMCAGLEVMAVPFITKKEWARILSNI